MASSSSRPAKRKSKEGDDGPLPNWLELPSGVTAKILHKLSPFEILSSARLVCPSWWTICKDPLMWRTIDLINPYRYTLPTLVKISRLAIGLSCGHLEDIRIESCGTNDQVLKCIADNGASRLRRMQLLECLGISDKGLSEAVKKFPLLEELEITMIGSCLSKDTVELIGQCCPFLKSLKLEPLGKLLKVFFDYDGVALAIAKNMPELRHLQLFHNALTDDCLLAIVNGCHHLEYIGLGCYNFDLRGLREQPPKKMKVSYFPLDYEEDDEDFDF